MSANKNGCFFMSDCSPQTGPWRMVWVPVIVVAEGVGFGGRRGAAAWTSGWPELLGPMRRRLGEGVKK